MILYSSIAFIALIGGIALMYALYKAVAIYRLSVDNENLKRISNYISDGAMAFLRREYRALFPFVLCAALFLFFINKNELRWGAIAFVFGAVCSALAGYIGMKVATTANSRTTSAACKSLKDALQVAFSGGSVMGMCVVGLALVGISIVLFVTTIFFGGDGPALANTCLPILIGFSFGASSIALFARVGGGIYTKAADIGADLVGKVEAGIPEDEACNPATIADNVGDNVGDVAGMGADLFESYVGSVIGCMMLGAMVSVSNPGITIKLVSLPLIFAAIGVIASLIGFLFVKCISRSPQTTLNIGSFSAAIVALILSWPLCAWVLGGDSFAVARGDAGSLSIFLSLLSGLVIGILIGSFTEYFTATDRYPVDQIVKATETGTATTLITGMEKSMMSAAAPIICICVAVLLSYYLAGLYGVAVAVLGMLMTLGFQLSIDAYGPIADNAGGLANMSEFPKEVRQVTDELDAVGNTTAAIGKGFALGSAALTALILFNVFREQSGVESIILTDPKVVVGIFLGAVVPYVFSALMIGAVGRAAFCMIEEVRRQFRAIKGLLSGHAEPDYAKCIDISTVMSLKAMMLPGIMAALLPVAVGFLGGIDMLAGFLIGATSSGVVLAVFMVNSGGAWDNAKKMVERTEKTTRLSESYKAAIIADTVGDPLKDTAGPSINILIKLIAIVSIIIAPILKMYGR